MAPPEAVALVDDEGRESEEERERQNSRTLAMVLFSLISFILLCIYEGTKDLDQLGATSHRQLNDDDFFTPFDAEAAVNPTTTPNPEDGSMIPYMERGMEFAGATRLVWRNVLIPSECCARCQNDAQCRVWVLDSDTHECSLKWVQPNATLQKA
eukprot:Skav208747  [mRNA]  locus=scaffold1871:18584:24131:+ [translate_table: standard]